MHMYGPDTSILLFTEHPLMPIIHQNIILKKEDDALSTELYYGVSGALKSMLMSVFIGGGGFLGLCKGWEYYFFFPRKNIFTILLQDDNKNCVAVTASNISILFPILSSN